MKDAERYQKIPIASFRIGQQLPFDIYEAEDGREVMLLKRGSVVTPRFLSNMQDRKLGSVLVQNEDLKKCVAKAADSKQGARVDLETDATRELDGEGEISISAGVALIESFRPRESVPYDRELVDKLIQGRDHDVEKLSDQLSDLVSGSREVVASSMQSITSQYIWHMAQDLDATLSVSQLPAKENYMANHSLQMAVMGMSLAAEMRLPKEEVNILGIAGLLHDVGMSKVPGALLEANRPLNTLEFLEVMKHPIYTLDMIDRVSGVPNRCRVLAYQVHERQDGNGYPRKRQGRSIYLLAKILGMVDSYLALISDRPYRKALLPYQALERILYETQRGVWDPQVTRAFLSLVGLFPVGSFVMLSDDSLAKVIRSGGTAYDKPQVTVTHNADGIPQDSDTVIDLSQESDLRVVKAIQSLYSFVE